MKYTPELVDRLCDLVSKGVNITKACDLVGVRHETYMNWKREHSDFSDRIKQSQAECYERHVGVVNQVGIDDWKASAWWLERKHNNEFGRRDRVDTRTTIQMSDDQKAFLNALNEIASIQPKATDSGADRGIEQDKPIDRVNPKRKNSHTKVADIDVPNFTGKS